MVSFFGSLSKPILALSYASYKENREKVGGCFFQLLFVFLFVCLLNPLLADFSRPPREESNVEDKHQIKHENMRSEGRHAHTTLV